MLRPPNAGYQGLEAVRVGDEVVIVAGVTHGQSRLETVTYDLGSRSWAYATSPFAWRYDYSAVKAGGELLVFGRPAARGGAEGIRYDPARDEWRTMAPSPLSPRSGHSAVWTGEEMIVWGGRQGGGGRADGAAYEPRADSWHTIAASPLSGRYGHAAVWTGEEMIVWSGATDGEASDFELLSADAAAYDPEADAWRSIPDAPVPAREGQRGAKAVWTGEEMIVWNGSEGAAYDPDEDAWRRLPDPPVEDMRYDDTAVWTGEEMIVWGGDPSGGQDGFDDGAAYHPHDDQWRPLPDAPITGRYQHVAAWTGEAMMAWGGCCDDSSYFEDGALYVP